jgi:uncharacterized protein (DUF488 family)
MSHQFFTIGHSTRSIDEFLALLNPHNIKLVVDVRTIPRSRTNPQYNSKELTEALSAFQIGYQHIPSLGGLRGRARILPKERNAFWKNQSFHNYADYATSNEFRSGLATLRELGHETTSAIMCAELLWWRCHRRIIADYLIASADTVFHILGSGSVKQARLTEGAQVQPDGTVTYPSYNRELNNTLAANR